ncbi:Peptidoglycan/xylan/chitin deacetylase, PgdA/CDA1 family [Halarsenatibacter silvermanii]|uniref:Peptidoglycan/xylan/chitin deacetylase, PgdA/CDA1 family n=1 Tax=Halarsenatibacter silvermanii TaxID=321763 RepID=A0A1G9LXF9_9FIRM|nr:Peptidoglycan/xylan/chitin deacetylase, PgdA/CDA1 family [Halarsenatibacter silvermanii]
MSSKAHTGKKSYRFLFVRAAVLILAAILFLLLPGHPVRGHDLVADEYISRYRELENKFPGTFYMSGNREKQKVALSFDDGPSPQHTPEILDILAEYSVPATFFLLGQEAAEHTWLVERIAREGHELGNHSYTHRNFTGLEWSAVEEEIRRTGQLIDDITGEYPRLVRPPYGGVTIGQLQRFEQSDYKLVNWSVDAGDYEEENQPEILLARIQLQMHPGAIILLHDGGGDRSSTIRILPELIEMLQDEGFTFTTVGELIDSNYY